MGAANAEMKLQAEGNCGRGSEMAHNDNTEKSSMAPAPTMNLTKTLNDTEKISMEMQEMTRRYLRILHCRPREYIFLPVAGWPEWPEQPPTEVPVAGWPEWPAEAMGWPARPTSEETTADVTQHTTDEGRMPSQVEIEEFLEYMAPDSMPKKPLLPPPGLWRHGSTPMGLAKDRKVITTSNRFEVFSSAPRQKFAKSDSSGHAKSQFKETAEKLAPNVDAPTRDGLSRMR